MRESGSCESLRRRNRADECGNGHSTRIANISNPLPLLRGGSAGSDKQRSVTHIIICLCRRHTYLDVWKLNRTQLQNTGKNPRKMRRMVKNAWHKVRSKKIRTDTLR